MVKKSQHKVRNYLIASVAVVVIILSVFVVVSLNISGSHLSKLDTFYGDHIYAYMNPASATISQSSSQTYDIMVYDPSGVAMVDLNNQNQEETYDIIIFTWFLNGNQIAYDTTSGDDSYTAYGNVANVGSNSITCKITDTLYGDTVNCAAILIVTSTSSTPTPVPTATPIGATPTPIGATPTPVITSTSTPPNLFDKIPLTTMNIVYIVMIIGSVVIVVTVFISLKTGNRKGGIVV